MNIFSFHKGSTVGHCVSAVVMYSVYFFIIKTVRDLNYSDLIPTVQIFSLLKNERTDFI